jgi:hypothetical protein
MNSGGKTCPFVYLYCCGIEKSVLKLAVRGSDISGRFVQRQRVSIFERHRLPSTGSRYDIQWVSGGGETCYLLF